MRIIRSLIAPAAALAVASGIAVLPALTSATPASAQASCTGSSAYNNSANHLVFVPTIGDDTHLDSCELGLGNDSNAMFWLQTTLNFCYGAGLTTDGDFGPLTQAAVRHAQHLAGVTVDGIYGPQTRDHIKWVMPLASARGSSRTPA